MVANRLVHQVPFLRAIHDNVSTFTVRSTDSHKSIKIIPRCVAVKEKCQQTVDSWKGCHLFACLPIILAADEVAE